MTPHATRFQRKCSFEMGITQSISTSIAVTTRQSMLITSPTLISTMSTNSRTWFQAEPSSEHGQDSIENGSGVKLTSYRNDTQQGNPLFVY